MNTVAETFQMQDRSLLFVGIGKSICNRQRQSLRRGGLPAGHMSEVRPGATVPQVTAALTNQGSEVNQGSLGTQSGGRD